MEDVQKEGRPGFYRLCPTMNLLFSRLFNSTDTAGIILRRSLVDATIEESKPAISNYVAKRGDQRIPSRIYSMTPGEQFRHGEKNSLGAIYSGPHVKLEMLEKCEDADVGENCHDRKCLSTSIAQ